MPLRRLFGAAGAMLIAVALTLIALPPGQVQAAGTAVVSVVSPTQIISPGQQFNVTISVNPNDAIAGAQFSLLFDASLASVISVTEGNLLSQGGADTYFRIGQVNNPGGTVTGVAGAIISPGQTVSTAGTLAVVTMTARSTSGTCPLNLSNVIVGNINGQAIPVLTVSGHVNISGSTANTPTPTLAGDHTAPLISDITATDITSTGVTIRWITNEESTSQLKYGTNLELLLSSIETAPTTTHVVQLKSLLPSTIYRFKIVSRDVAGNLAESEEYSFTTLGQPATVSVSNLRINPREASINEPVTVSVTLNNTGNNDVNFDVILTISSAGSESETLKRTVLVSAGASQNVDFVVTKQSVGTFAVSVGGLADSFVINTGTNPAVASGAQPEIELFSAIPSYAEGLRITSVRIAYELVNPGEEPTDARLVLKVGLDGQPLEDVVLLSDSVLALGSTFSTWDFVPTSAWTSGSYTFRVELYSYDILVVSTPDQAVKVKIEQPVVVSWYTLALIIGACGVVALLTVVLVLRRRRELIRTWSKR